MSTFTDKQQAAHRKAFIEECHQNAWGARCNADFIAKGLDDLMTQYTKLKAEDDQLAADFKELENAPDHHTVDNRGKRRGLQGKRETLAKQLQIIAEHAKDGQKAIASLLQTVENALALSEYASTWEWKEAQSATEPQPGD